MNELIPIQILVSSEYGTDDEVVQGVYDLLIKNELIPTRDGRIIDLYTHDAALNERTDKDDETKVKDEPVKIKRTTGNNQWSEDNLCNTLQYHSNIQKKRIK